MVCKKNEPFFGKRSTGVTCPILIRITQINMQMKASITFQRNLKKIQETGDVKHKGGNGRIKKITTNASQAIGQYIQRQPSISARSVADKLKDIGVDVTRSTVSRHLVNLGY